MPSPVLFKATQQQQRQKHIRLMELVVLQLLSLLGKTCIMQHTVQPAGHSMGAPL